MKKLLILLVLIALAITGGGFLWLATHRDTEDPEISDTDTISTEDFLSEDLDTDLNDATTIDLTTQTDSDAWSWQNNVLTINKGGRYLLSGTLSGQVIIDAGKMATVHLGLDGVNITSPNGPALIGTSADKLIITLMDNTTINTLTDTTEKDDAYDAVMDIAMDLSLNGNGTLTVDGVDKAIRTHQDLRISGGSYQLSAEDDALYATTSLAISEGEFTIQIGADGIKTNNDGGSDLGAMVLSGGTYTIDAGDDAITSVNDLTILGGTYTLRAVDDGVHADLSLRIEDGTITVLRSEEGLEGSDVTITGGHIDVTSNDDGINGAGDDDRAHDITISGGDILVDATGDGLDVNGNLTISGGQIIVFGPQADDNGALDADGQITISGGTLLAVGASGMAVAPDANGQNVVSITPGTITKDQIITLTDGESFTISFRAPRSFNSIVVSDAGLITGQTLSVQSHSASDDFPVKQITNTALTDTETLTTITITEGNTGNTQGQGNRPGRP